MSSKQTTQSAARVLETNPLAMFARGMQLKTELPRHLRSAAVGNLYFEYVQNVSSLRGIVRSGRQVAEYLEYKGLITWDRGSDRYIWKQEPISKTEFLQMIRQPTQANA